MNPGKQIKLIITDFDGTLVNTFNANYYAYRKAFEVIGKKLTKETYHACFGLRFNEFMISMGVNEQNAMLLIKQLKQKFYPEFFNLLIPNKALLSLIKAFHLGGGLTAIASTASYKNLIAALRYIDAYNIFDLIYSGEDVQNAKPHPEIYKKIITQLGVSPLEAIVFEDSEIGKSAASSAGINHIIIDKNFYEN